jgi:hypothetical protein
MAGFLTNLKIWAATIFVDPFSDYVYVALMCDLTLDEKYSPSLILNVMLMKVELLSIPIMQTIDNLQILAFNKW